MSVTLVKPKHIFSFSYDFADEKGAIVASIQMPFLAKLLKSNSATILSGTTSYLLVDAMTIADTYVGGGIAQPILMLN